MPYARRQCTRCTREFALWYSFTVVLHLQHGIQNQSMLHKTLSLSRALSSPHSASIKELNAISHFINLCALDFSCQRNDLLLI